MTPTRRSRSLRPVVDGCEARLSLSGVVGNHGVGNVVADAPLNPQPIPPGRHLADIQGAHIGTNVLADTARGGDGDLNPQPLPPGYMM